MGGDEDMMTNETARSSIVDGDEPMMSSCTSASSGSDNNNAVSAMACTEIVRKKRSGWNVCARLMAANNKVSDEDMATSFSRRKGVPHRSPLC